MIEKAKFSAILILVRPQKKKQRGKGNPEHVHFDDIIMPLTNFARGARGTTSSIIDIIDT